MQTVASVIQDLEIYGPGVQGSGSVSLVDARRYCSRLARSHYENFTVVSWLLPKPLRQHFYNIYAYCRWADDLADEAASPEQSLELLGWWERQLDDCFRGETRHPVFVALRETVAEFSIPIEPFRDLLVAFRQDQVKTRYETFDELTEYCRNSANPVGRLVLYLGRCHNGETVALSDSVCTGLQLANFWQDVARDFKRGRVYIPQESLRQFACDEGMLQRGEMNGPLRKLLAREVRRAAGFLEAGWPLVEMAPAYLRFDMALFIHGGLAILKAIERQDFDVLSRRPRLGKADKFGLMIKAWLRRK